MKQMLELQVVISPHERSSVKDSCQRVRRAAESDCRHQYSDKNREFQR